MSHWGNDVTFDSDHQVIDNTGERTTDVDDSNNNDITNDEVIEDKGVKVYIDSAAVMYLLGTEMDYKTDELSSTFVFNNPNETERCGCGESFKV